jgi:hypothetical protein
MNFDKESNVQSKYHQSISEDIEYSKTNKLASQSLADKNKSKKNIKAPQPLPVEQPPTIKQTKTEHSEPSQVLIDEGPPMDRPIDLGFQVWETIQVDSLRFRNVIIKRIKFQQKTLMCSTTSSCSKRKQYSSAYLGQAPLR